MNVKPLIMARDFGLSRPERLAVATAMFGRDVTSFKRLSPGEQYRLGRALDGAGYVCTIVMEKRRGERHHDDIADPPPAGSSIGRAAAVFGLTNAELTELAAFCAHRELLSWRAVTPRERIELEDALTAALHVYRVQLARKAYDKLPT